MTPPNRDPAEGPNSHWPASTWSALLAALTLLTFLVQGYHPYAEDGGMYLARVLAKLNPALFPRYAEFVREPLRVSLYSPLIVALVHLHLSLDWVLLAIKLGELWLTLYAGLQILRRCVTSDWAQLAGVALLGAWSTMPVAATSLLLIDPSVTARSFSTPFTLLALAYAMDNWRTPASPSHGHRPAIACVSCLVAAFAFHPLMAAYAAWLVVTLQLMRSPRKLLAWTIPLAAPVLLSAVIQAFAPPEPSAVVAADLSRYYWFLSQWHWYELIGLAGPLAVLASMLRVKSFSPAARDLCRAAIAFGVAGTIVALAFAHESYRTHLVARFQPLRVFCLVYALLPLLLGAAVAELSTQATRSTRLRETFLRSLPAAVIVLSGVVMFLVQRSSFPASRHLELPWREGTSPNPWVGAFLWIRHETPQDALFAIDARYVNTPGEDAQIFRAIAQRSVLPDFSKDGGEASQMPWLADAWQQTATAQRQLSVLSDDARDARLLRFGAGWMVVQSSAPTAHPCPYNNGVIKVCELPHDTTAAPRLVLSYAPAPRSMSLPRPPSASVQRSPGPWLRTANRTSAAPDTRTQAR